MADSQHGFALVADGMGGYACGEVASDIVKTTIAAAVADNEGLEQAILRAHQAVKHAANDNTDRKGMGSTVVAMKTTGLDYQIAWVGDSRAYIWDGQQTLKQITRDHSYVEQLLATGSISREEAINHPNRNLITQAIGVEGKGGLEIGFVSGRISSGQAIILCSDGLVDEVVDEDIAELMHASDNAEDTLHQLLAAALTAGARDNVTVVIASATEDSSAEQQAAIEPTIIRETKLVSANTDSPKENQVDQNVSSSRRHLITVATVLLIVTALTYLSFGS